MNIGGIAPVSSPSPASGRPDSSRAASAVATVSVALILLYVFWRFVWQSKKHSSRDDGIGDVPSAPPPQCLSPSAACGASVDVERGDNQTELLPVFVHVAASAAAEGEEKAECAVCLVEFAHGEAGRLVPGCGHGFHAACIETWFQVMPTCPLCRGAVAQDGRSGAPDQPQGWRSSADRLPRGAVQ